MGNTLKDYRCVWQAAATEVCPLEKDSRDLHRAETVLVLSTVKVKARAKAAKVKVDSALEETYLTRFKLQPEVALGTATLLERTTPLNSNRMCEPSFV